MYRVADQFLDKSIPGHSCIFLNAGTTDLKQVLFSSSFPLSAVHEFGLKEVFRLFVASIFVDV